MIAVGVALVLDRILREPPLQAHPVRGMGALLQRISRHVPAGPPGQAVVSGAAGWAVGLASTVLAAVALDRAAGHLPRGPRAVVRGVALWPLLSLTMLVDEVAAAEAALAADLDSARVAVARLVSRDVSAADAEAIRAAAIESLAENASDSVVAPLLWFAVGGLPAAAAYRLINTADAMWGYRTRRWHSAGRVAALADDVVNLVPARLTGLALAGSVVRVADLRREAARTPSPNAGWPMAAVALRLGIRLGKPGVYRLNPSGRPPGEADTAAALRLVRRRTLGLSAVLAAVAAVRRRPCRH